MTCTHCIDSEGLFDLKNARKDQKRFRKKGPNKATRLLVEMLKKQGVENKTLLDIGGGIGAIQLGLLKAVLARATDVDASKSYLAVAEEEANSKGYSGSVKYLHGDFMDQQGEIQAHDFVSLDKVICCYPNREALLANAIDHADGAIGLVFPHGNFLSKAFAKMANLYMRLKGSAFRTYAHSPLAVHQQLIQNGFSQAKHGRTFIWKVWLYTKN